jgi:hypothetical protein
VSLPIVSIRALALNRLGSRVLRAVAIAVLTVGIQAPALVAAGGTSDASISLVVRAPFAAAVAEGTRSTVVPLNDDGEDHFDAGDDEFNCDNVNEGEDRCQDNPPDRLDAGDDEFEAGDEAGCDNYDDGEDRCLDNGEDRFDAGDDEFEGGCANDDDGNDRCLDSTERQLDQTLSTRAPADAALAAASPAAAASPDPIPGFAALGAVIALGAGGVWLLRRAQR